jgi:hypothetical protein
MHQYCKELEELIVDTLLPIYLEHHRLKGISAPISKINTRLLQAAKSKTKIPRLLQGQNYGRK